MVNVLVLQIEDRSDDQFLQDSMQINKDICEQNNMQYEFLYKSKDNVPPYWGKVFEIDRILSNNAYSNIDYVFWIDSDAFFLNFDKNKLYNFLNQYSKYSMIITKDPPPWKANFNAGSFIVKNDVYGREIVSYWKSLYNSNNWQFENNQWKTNSQYAGDDYEQGSFATYILTNNEYSKHIKVVPYYILNNTSCIENTNETIVSHLAGKYKNNKETVENCKNVTNKPFYNTYIGWIVIIVIIILIIIVILTMLYNKKLQLSVYKFFKKIFH
jgi:hypothetical protein